jgi:tensin
VWTTVVAGFTVCSVMFVASVELESLTGPEAVHKAVSEAMHVVSSQQSKTTVVQVEVAPTGITVTDVKRT